MYINFVVHTYSRENGIYYTVTSNNFETLHQVQEFLEQLGFSYLTSQDVDDFQSNYGDHTVTKFFDDRGYTVYGYSEPNPFDYEPLM